MVIAAAAGLASNLAVTVPLAIAAAVGVIGPSAESLFIPTRNPDPPPRRPSDRERDRRARERRRTARRALGREASQTTKEMERSAP